MKRNPIKKRRKNPETKKEITADILYNLKKLKDKLQLGKYSSEQLKRIDLQIADLV